MRLIHNKFLTLPAQAIPARLWGISEHENMVEISRLMLTKLMTEGNKHGFCCLVVSNVARRRSNGVLEQVSKPAVWLQDIMEDDSVNNILLRQNYASVDLADFLDKGLALDIKFAEGKKDTLFDVSTSLMNLLRGFPFGHGSHHDTTHRPKTFSDNIWWNRSFKGRTQVKNEFVKKEFVKKENIHWKTEITCSDFASKDVIAEIDKKSSLKELV